MERIITAVKITLIRAEGAGKVILIKTSRADGGTTRSPFLTAPFMSIARAFGEDTILKK